MRGKGFLSEGAHIGISWNSGKEFISDLSVQACVMLVHFGVLELGLYGWQDSFQRAWAVEGAGVSHALGTQWLADILVTWSFNPATGSPGWGNPLCCFSYLAAGGRQGLLVWLINRRCWCGRDGGQSQTLSWLCSYLLVTIADGGWIASHIFLKERLLCLPGMRQWPWGYAAVEPPCGGGVMVAILSRLWQL